MRFPDRGTVGREPVQIDFKIDLIHPRERRAALKVLVALVLIGVSVATYLRPVQPSFWAAHGNQPPSTSTHLPNAEAAYPTPETPAVAQTGNPNCPSTAPLDPGRDAETEVRAAAVEAVPSVYATRDLAGWHIASVQPALPDKGVGQIAYGMCGSFVGSRTWEVDLTFPADLPSASGSQGQMFLSRFPDGWRVWFTYH